MNIPRFFKAGNIHNQKLSVKLFASFVKFFIKLQKNYSCKNAQKSTRFLCVFTFQQAAHHISAFEWAKYPELPQTRPQIFVRIAYRKVTTCFRYFSNNFYKHKKEPVS